MASNDNNNTTFKKYDRNRFRKIYPINRQPPSFSFRSNEAVVMESLTIPFYATGTTDRGSETAVGSLKEIYAKIPAIMVAPARPPNSEYNAMSGDQKNQIDDTMNVNLFISEIILDSAGKVNFTIQASDWFAGDAAVTVVGLG